VSCKIRLLPEQSATIDLVRQIAETGISCLTVHCRTQDMRPREPALLHRLREIVDVVTPYGIPVVANGDCFKYEDIDRIRKLTSVSSLMIARGAEVCQGRARVSALITPRR
jgi:tRNA-dihydrouridine synthase 2